MKNIQLGEHDFASLIEFNGIYVDKTEQIHKMLRYGRYLFFARPRRFGKSLLTTTLEALFLGKKELFKDLYIYDKWNWIPQPVIRIDFSPIKSTETIDIFKRAIIFSLERHTEKYDLIIEETEPSLYLQALVWQLHQKTGQKVILLIDEYDSPIVSNLNDVTNLEGIQRELRVFYKSIKALSPHWRLVFITGISKFAKTSIFSVMNNLDDISFLPQFNDLVGFTEQDLSKYFNTYIHALQKKENTSQEELLSAIKTWYNGYSWNGESTVYNPVSILSLFHHQRFDNYWFSTATPKFLIDIILKEAQGQTWTANRTIEEFENKWIAKEAFQSFEVQHIILDALLVQTGYLTVKKAIYEDRKTFYLLDYPNQEVRESFITYLLDAFTHAGLDRIQPDAYLLKLYLKKGDMANFIKLIRRFFARILGRLRKNVDEAWYHSLFYMILALIGFDLLLERQTSLGMIDGVLVFDNKIYITEFKYGKKGKITMETLTKKAVQQIIDNKYYESYEGTGLPIFFLGVGFLDKEIDYKMMEWKSSSS